VHAQHEGVPRPPRSHHGAAPAPPPVAGGVSRAVESLAGRTHAGGGRTPRAAGLVCAAGGPAGAEGAGAARAPRRPLPGRAGGGAAAQARPGRLRPPAQSGRDPGDPRVRRPGRDDRLTGPHGPVEAPVDAHEPRLVVATVARRKVLVHRPRGGLPASAPIRRSATGRGTSPARAPGSRLPCQRSTGRWAVLWASRSAPCPPRRPP
jgi:hypothetical protein